LRQATQKTPGRRPLAIQMGHRIREGLLIIASATALFLLVSFMTYHGSDPGWLGTAARDHIANWGGRVGAFLADIFLSLFGYMAYLLLPLTVYASWLGIQPVSEEMDERRLDWVLKSFGFILIIVSACGLMNFAMPTVHLPIAAGGILGDLVGNALLRTFNPVGGLLFLITILLCGITLFSGLSWLGLFDFIRGGISQKLNREERVSKVVIAVKAPVKAPVKKEEPTFLAKMEAKFKKPEKPIAAPVVVKPAAIEEASDALKKRLAAHKASKANTSSVTVAPGTVPPLNLLSPIPPPQEKAFTNTTFEELSNLVEQRLNDFGVEVKVVAVHPGPVITRFELELAPGIKVSKISGLAKDIARSLSATSVRVVEVIPGKSVIGLELPNEHRFLA
jgi:S-DNA-T family DNA segregation ATPase FtsK/SpoIIIE